MKISMLLKNMLVVSLLLVSLSAEDTKINYACDDTYDMCIVKCEDAKSGQEDCVTSCDDKYDKCLAAQELIKD